MRGKGAVLPSGSDIRRGRPSTAGTRRFGGGRPLWRAANDIPDDSAVFLLRLSHRFQTAVCTKQGPFFIMGRCHHGTS